MASHRSEPISFEEYDRAYRAFLRCLIDSGVGFIDRGFDPWTGLYDCSTEADDEFEARTGRIPSDDCYDRHFAEASARWQHQVERDHLVRRWEIAVEFMTGHGVDIPPEIAEHRSLGRLHHHASTFIDGVTLKRFGLDALDLR